MSRENQRVARSPARCLEKGIIPMDPLTDTPEREVVLLAEDDPDQSDMLRELLEAHGYVVETAFSGDVALRRLTAKTYTAAVMDGRMPGLHGGTVLKACRALNRKTPIVMVSAFATPADKERFQRDGAVASFSKPLKVAELLSVLRGLSAAANKTVSQTFPVL